MPVFPIKWQLPNLALLDEESRVVNKLELNDEWTIIFVLLVKQELNWCWVVNSIEIHRRNTAREFLVSGELAFKKDGTVSLIKKVSQFIKTGSSFTEICSNLYSCNIAPNSCINGILNISEADEKHPTGLTKKETKERIQLNSLEDLSKNLERLLIPDSPCFADVTLKCDHVSILAHKNILSARSPVFAAMFAHPMKESLKNEVDVTDIDVPTLRALLKYMYTGKTSDLTASSAADLMFAADKYHLPDLKTACTYFLKETVSVENMWKILVVGDMHSEDLKSFMVDYICDKCGELSVLKNTQEWKTFRKERPDLAIDLLESLVKYKDEKLKR